MTSNCLGSGAFATVHLAFDKDKNRQVACKTIKTKKDSEMLQFMAEVRILAGLNHVCFASYLACGSEVDEVLLAQYQPRL